METLNRSVLFVHFNEKRGRKKTPPTGLEPAIFGCARKCSPGTPIRRPTPYPLGHGGEHVYTVKKLVIEAMLTTIATKGAVT